VLHHTRRIGAAALAFVVVGIILMRLVGTGSCPKWTKARSSWTTSHPVGRRWRKLTVKSGSWRIFSRTLQRSKQPPVATGAELGLFATSQNTGDIAGAWCHATVARGTFSPLWTTCGARSTLRTPAHIEFVQILSDVINISRQREARSRSSCSASAGYAEAYAERLAPDLEGVQGLEDMFNVWWSRP